MLAEWKLIEAVRKHRELYDTKHASYMKSKLKYRIWCDIAKELNLKDGKESKNMWLKLRAGFRDARRRQQKCLKSGAAQNIKPWKFQNQMSFLEPFMTTGSREGNVTDNSDDDSHLQLEPPGSENLESQDVESSRGETEEWSQLDADINVVKEKTDVEQPVFTDEGVNDDGNDDDENRRRMEFSIPPTTSSTSMIYPKKKKKFNDFYGLLNRSMQQREERARQRAEDRRKLLEENKNTDDPLYNFFLSMYQLVKNMPPHYQHRVRAQVFQAVSEAEAEIMNISFNQPSSTHDSDASSIVLNAPHPTSHPSSQTSPYSQHITSIHHEHQVKQEFENLPVNSS